MNIPSAYDWTRVCALFDPVVLDLVDLRDFGATFHSAEAAEEASDRLMGAGFSVYVHDREVRGFPTAIEDPDTGQPHADAVAEFQATVERLSQARRESRS